MIGIKIANGEYYPILGDEEAGAKRLVLTTVKDDQQTVHIDLYRGEGEGFSNPSYLGSLVIDGISGRPKQVPDIELSLAVDEAGELKVRASDRESGTSRSLTVALTQGAEEPEFTIPDFELDTEPEMEEPAESPRRVPASSLTQLRDEEEEEEEEETQELPAPATKPAKAAESTLANQDYRETPAKRGLSPLAIALVIVAGIAILVLLGFLLYRCVGPRPGILPSASPSPVAAASPEPSPLPSPSPSPTATPTPSASTDVLGKNGSKGLTIRIKWGDTLWDLATRYYGNPWLYKKIAKANKIKNPNLIISGHMLWIPPR